jgi:peptidoglycan/LPS O-acetylase OafA/YrhL
MYRRVRRSFGRQTVQPGRLKFRVGLFLLLGALFLFFFARSVLSVAAMGAGIGAGLLLGYFGLKHTKFDISSQGRFYTPHTYIGLFVTGLFIFRIVIRYVNVYANPQFTGPPRNPMAAYQNPLTLGIFGLVIGYYVFFNIGILKKSSSAVPVTNDVTESPAS